MLCGSCVVQSMRDAVHGWYTLVRGTKYPRDALFKGRNIQELSVGDASVRDTSILHREVSANEYSCAHGA